MPQLRGNEPTLGLNTEVKKARFQGRMKSFGDVF
jgi:hypothetical protein